MDLPKRKANRLNGYNYAQNGGYFITMCIKAKQNLLWNVGATCGRPPYSSSYLNNYGLIIENEINHIENIYNHTVVIDKYVIMPNHIHMIIVLSQLNNISSGPPQVAPTISHIIQQLKGTVTKKIGASIWQKSFHDHIIRNEQEYQKIWQYIETNPLTWEKDCFYQL